MKDRTDQASAKFVPPEERIATFDQDGTLWVEHPMYTQVVYCLDRVAVLAKTKPELKEVEPFKTVLSGNREAMARLSMKDLEKILAATLTGMSVERFAAEAKDWLTTAKDPRWKRPYNRTRLSAHAGGDEPSPGQWLPDLYSDGRWTGFRPRLQ